MLKSNGMHLQVRNQEVLNKGAIEAFVKKAFRRELLAKQKAIPETLIEQIARAERALADLREEARAGVTRYTDTQIDEVLKRTVEGMREVDSMQSESLDQIKKRLLELEKCQTHWDNKKVLCSICEEIKKREVERQLRQQKPIVEKAKG